MILKDLLIEDYPLVFKDSVVILDDKPFFIHSFNGVIAECMNIGSQDYEKIDFTTVKSIKMPNTGMVNHRGVVVFTMRVPCRRYKHGLSKENIIVTNSFEENDSPDFIARVRDAHQQTRQLVAKTLYNTYMNLYPSLSDSLELLQDGAYALAFDRQFAITNNQKIIYKDKVVGNLSKEHKIIFKPKYEHLYLCLPKGL